MIRLSVAKAISSQGNVLAPGWWWLILPVMFFAGEGQAQDLSRQVDGDTETGALELLSTSTTRQTKHPIDLYSAWNARINTFPPPPVEKPEPLAKVALEVPTGVKSAPAKKTAFPWWYLGAGLALGAIGVWTASRVGRALSGGREDSRKVVVSKPGGRDVSFVSGQVLDDQGTLVVVDVEGERLVVGINAERSSAALVTRVEPGVQREGAGAAQVDPEKDVEALWARAAQPGGERLVGWPLDSVMESDLPDLLASRLTPEPDGAQAPPREGGNKLVDELLEKVRGRKSLAKRADEL